MPVIESPLDFVIEDLYVDLGQLTGSPLFLKCEGFNFAGSIKLKAAAMMVRLGEEAGSVTPGSTLVESSSGNMGVALSVVAASRGYQFRCVTDARCTATSRRMMETLGAQVHVITEPDDEGGFLGARLRYIRELCESDPRYVWLNQYASRGNWLAHYRITAPAIARRFSRLGVLFIGTGTAGTLMGCARYFRETRPSVTIVAVDSVGSVTFGGPAGPRMIPGLGAGVRPPILDESYLDDVTHVPEPVTIRTCHRLAGLGYLFGGSTGTVVAGAQAWLATHELPAGAVAVAISPDLGERYLDTVYEEKWLLDNYGPDVLLDDVSPELAASSGRII